MSQEIVAGESFAELFSQSEKKIKEGEVVKGRILSMDDDHIQIDVGGKSEGFIDLWEFMDEQGNVLVAVGDEVDVLVEEAEDDDGRIVLSKDKADRVKVWDAISEAYEADRAVEGRILSRVKGGLSVDIGVKAFLPGSQVDLRPVRNLENLLGERLEFKIIKFNQRRGNIVLSRRALLEKEREQMRATTLETLQEGQIIDGVIKNITDYGAFIDLGGIDGLLHVTDMSWGRVNHPSELFRVGDEIKVKVLKFDVETERVSLGSSRSSRIRGWTRPCATRSAFVMNGKAVSLTDYGAFIELEPGIEGSGPRFGDVLDQAGQAPVEGRGDRCRGRGGRPRRRRVQPQDLAGHEADRAEPVGGDRGEIPDRYPRIRRDSQHHQLRCLRRSRRGDRRSGARFGHLMDRKHQAPEREVREGRRGRGVVLKIDGRTRSSLWGSSSSTANPWDDILKKYALGSEITGDVTNVTDFGAFVKLEDGIEGLIYSSELSQERSTSLRTS